MHTPPPPPAAPDPPPRRSSVVPLAVSPVPAFTDHVPTIIGENPLAPTQPPAAFDLPAGATLGHFEVTAPLGAGGMATVFRAKDTTLGREVALKILPPALAADPDAVARFKFEARAAAKLNHDQVARVFSIGEDRGLHFIAFEFVEGRTLRDLIDAGGPIAPADAVRYLLDAAVGLQHAAERGVVHRDVKPSNIVITPGGRAKLIDMGLARSVDPHSVNGGVTQSGMTLGTFDYISPEQAIDPRRADVRADIYSLGCTFYHALTGQPPVPDGNAARKLAAHQTESPTDPRLINPEVPDALAAVLDRMMAKKPEHRQQTAGELIADLGRVARELGLPDFGSESATASTPAVASPAADRSRLTAVSLGIGGAAVAFAVVVALTAGGMGRTGRPDVPWTDPPPKPTVTAEVPPTDPVPPRGTPSAQTVATRDELLKALKDGVPKITLNPGLYDLSETDGAVVSGKGCELHAAADEGVGLREGVVLRVAAVPRSEKPTDPRPGTLTFHKCESVKLKGLRVEVVPAGDAPRPVGLLFHDVPGVEIADCRFVLLPTAATDGALLAFTRPAAVSVKTGFFASQGWVGVELAGGVKADFTDCGFITRRAGVEVVASAEPTAPATTVTTTHATFLLNGTASAAVSVDKGAKCEFTAGHTLFAAPASTEPDSVMGRKPVVLRLADTADVATFAAQSGNPNAVYGVERPAAGPPPEVLAVSPWAGMKEVGDPFAALALKTDLPLLRVGKGDRDILGVLHLREGKPLYPDLPVLVESGVVYWQPDLDPTDKDKGLVPSNVFGDLKSAVAAVKGQATLRIRGKGTFEVPPQVLNDPKMKLTVRPEKEGTVTLTPAAGTDPRETTLFRLEAGELVLENLQFKMKPGAAADAAAVVSVSGGKKCEFKKCLFTLSERAKERERVAVVSLADVSEQMKEKEKFAGRPTVTLDDCLVRGRGRVVRAEKAIPADVSLTNVGVATDGPPAFEFGPPARSGGPLGLTLIHVTAALGGPLVDVQGGRRPLDDKPPPQVKVDVQADNCLFVALDSSTKPLLRTTALDPSAADRPLSWSSGGGNAFGGWTTFAELALDDPDPKKWDRADWKRWSGELLSTGGLLKGPKTAAAARPSDLEASDETTSGTGAKLKALPTPTDD